MEPEDDRQLSMLLQEWKVLGAPSSLEKRVLTKHVPHWRTWLTSSITVPIPVGFVAIATIVLLTILLIRDHHQVAHQSDAENISLKIFRPVENVQIRVIRSAHAIE